jgi:transposase
MKLSRVSATRIATRMQEVETVEPDDADKKQDQTSPELDQSAAQPVLTWAQAIRLLCTIPGISRRAAEGILAEIGLNMDRFPSSRHLARLRRDVSGQPRECRQTALWQDA